VRDSNRYIGNAITILLIWRRISGISWGRNVPKEILPIYPDYVSRMLNVAI